MDFNQPLGGRTTSSGIWVPEPGAKSDRSQTGLVPKSRDTYSGILSEGRRAENRFKDLDSYIRAVKSVPWVWACVSVIAYNFANNQYQLLDPDGKEIEDAFDPFLRLWEKPNPRQTGFHFRELLMHYLMLAGEAFISLEEWDGNDTPHEMYLPNPARMQVIQGRHTGEVIGYEYNAGGPNTVQGWSGVVPYEPFEILHIKFANPLDELRGLGAIEAMESTLNIVAEMTGTELSYWRSGGRITGVLQTDQEVDNLTFERLVNRWRDFTATGRDRSRFKTAILEQGLKYQPIAEGLRGIDMVKLENSKRDEVTAALGVPLQKLGIFSADTGYKADDADRFFYGETMEPIFTRVEDGGAQPLVDIFNPDNIFRFARRNYEDDTVKLNNAKIMQSLGFTFGEVSDYLGVDPPDDIRKDMIFPMPGAAPITLEQLKSMGAQPVEHPMGPPPPPVIKPMVAAIKPPQTRNGQIPLRGTQPSATGTENGRSNRVDGAGHLPNPVESAVKYLSEFEREELRVQMEEMIKTAVLVNRAKRRPVEAKGLAKLNYRKKAADGPLALPPPRRAAGAPGAGEMMRRATAAIRARLVPRHKIRIQEALDAQRRSLTPVLSEAIPAFRQLETPEERQAWLRERWPAEPLQEAVRNLHVEAANDGWALGKRSLGFGKDAGWEVKVDASGVEDFVAEVLADRYQRLPERRITGMDETTIQAVESMVSEGVRRGYSALQIANGVEQEDYLGVASVFTGAPTWATDPEAMPGFEYRAELIARTESMFAANWGATTAMIDSGLSQVEALDGDGDPECAARDGQIFELDPDTGRAVDDLGEPVEDHPNGTLAWAPVIDIAPVETGALDDTGDVVSFEGAAGWEPDEDEDPDWEMKYGTGQNNNPEGHNQYSHSDGGGSGSGGGSGGGSSSDGHRSGGHADHPAHHGGHTGRRKRGGGGGGGGGGRSTTASPKKGRRGGRGGIRHTHANGTSHQHTGGAVNHAHSSGSTRTADQATWDAYMSNFSGRSAPGEAKAAGLKYSDDEPRDDHGRWTAGGGGTISSIDDAIRLLGEGKGVMFDRPERVVTLLNRLSTMAKEAKAAGQKAKVYDLCKVSVTGTNLFCSDNVGIPRSAMPQLKGVPVPGSPADSLPKDGKGEVNLGPAFRDYLGAQGHAIDDTNELASHLRASQTEMDGSKVGGMMQAMEEGKIPPESIFISKENYVIDGHHRWAATVGLDYKDDGQANMTMPVSRIDMPILDALAAANQFANTMGIPQAAVGVGNPLNKRLSAIEYRAAVVAVAGYAVEIKAVDGIFGEPVMASDLRLGPDIS